MENLNSNDISLEFSELCSKSSCLPKPNKLKNYNEILKKNRYSNIQPCKI